ncbi:MAG: HD domain-containing protein [Polyangiaceae bacterium]
MAHPIESSPASRFVFTAPASTGTCAAQARRIVVLDDDANMLRATERLLTAAGFSVMATTSPKVAIEAVVCEAPDAIISDLHMPEMGGQLVLAMVAHAAPRTARLLMTSETDFHRVASMAVPYAVHAFVSKQEAPARLVPIVEELCAGSPDASPEAISAEARALARTIVRALSLRQFESETHCERVAAWSRRLASRMGLSASRILDVELGALLHDVGQIGIADSILLKAGPLTADDWQEIRKHPDLGVALVAQVPALRRAIPVIECHHERRDGKGYPRGLFGNAIPIEARIFQVADAYDALVSDRPHRAGVSDEAARGEIARHVGEQFDPEVYDAFLNISAEEWAATVSHVEVA